VGEHCLKQLRLEHVHTFYNKCPTYLKDNFRKVEDYGCKTISRQLNFIIPKIEEVAPKFQYK
jgi:hypothetical protein